MHLLSRSLIDRAVGDEHTAECRYGVAGQCVFPSLEQRVARGQTAGVVVFEDGEGGIVKLGNQRHGGVDVEQVVVRNLLAVELLEHFVEVAIEYTLLVGILAIAQHLGVVAGIAEGRAFATVEVVEDGAVVSRRYGKCLFGKPATVFERGIGPLLFQQRQQRSVLGLRSHNNHILIVFGSGPYERDTAYIYLFDNSTLVGPRGYRLFKRIEIDDYQVDRGNFVLSDLLLVGFIFPAIEDSAENLGMKGLYPTAQDRGIAGQVLDCTARDSQRFDKRLCATGRNEFYAFGMQEFQNFV